jgi:hypothetical protein
MRIRMLSFCPFVIAPHPDFKCLLKSFWKLQTTLYARQLCIKQKKEFIYSNPLSGHKEPELLS